MNNEKINSKIKISNNSSFVILIFVILKFQNIGLLHSVVPNFDPHPTILPCPIDPLCLTWGGESRGKDPGRGSRGYNPQMKAARSFKKICSEFMIAKYVPNPGKSRNFSRTFFRGPFVPWDHFSGDRFFKGPFFRRFFSRGPFFRVP